MIQGNVTIGPCCILNQQCRIIAEEGGSINIGSHNMIEDQVVIRCSAGHTVTIGTHNQIGVGSHIQDAQVRTSVSVHVWNEVQPGLCCNFALTFRLEATTQLIQSANWARESFFVMIASSAPWLVLHNIVGFDTSNTPNLKPPACMPATGYFRRKV